MISKNTGSEPKGGKKYSAKEMAQLHPDGFVVVKKDILPAASTPGSTKNRVPMEWGSKAGWKQKKKQAVILTQSFRDAWRTRDFQSLKENLEEVRLALSESNSCNPSASMRVNGLVSTLIDILTDNRDLDDETVVESVRIIIHFVRREHHTIDVVRAGVLPTLRNLLDHASRNVVNITICCLGIIAGHNHLLANDVIHLDIHGYIARFLQIEGNTLILRQNTAQLLCSMCDARCHESFHLVTRLLEIALEYIRLSAKEDIKLLIELVEAVSNVFVNANGIQKVLACGLTDLTLIELLEDSGYVALMNARNTLSQGHQTSNEEQCWIEIITSVFRMLGSICNTNEYRMEVTTQRRMLEVFKKYLSCLVVAQRHIWLTGIVKETCLVLYNMVRVSPDYIQVVIDDEELLVILSRMLIPKTPFHFAADEACSVLSRLWCLGTDHQQQRLVAIPAFIQAVLVVFLAEFTCYSHESRQPWAKTAIELMVKTAGFQACIKTLKKDGFNIQNILNEGGIEVRIEYSLDVMIVLLALGYPKHWRLSTVYRSAKIRKSDIHIIIRLHELSIICLLLEPLYIRASLPKHGIWLPRDLWRRFRDYFVMSTKREIADLDNVNHAERYRRMQPDNDRFWRYSWSIKKSQKRYLF